MHARYRTMYDLSASARCPSAYASSLTRAKRIAWNSSAVRPCQRLAPGYASNRYGATAGPRPRSASHAASAEGLLAAISPIKRRISVSLSSDALADPVMRVRSGSRSSLHVALRRDLPIAHSRLLVRALGRLAFATSDPAHLLRPALVHRLETPLGAPARCADRPATHDHEDRIGVRRAHDAKCHPPASLHARVERHVAQHAVGADALARHRLSIQDQLHRDVARAGHARVLWRPVRLLHRVGRGGGEWLRRQQTRHLRRRAHAARLRQPQLAAVGSHREAVHDEAHQVTEPI